MCRFISWIEMPSETGKRILFLDDETIFSKRTKEILEGSKDNDFFGHHAVRAVYDLKSHQGEEHEINDFWNTEQLPEELRVLMQDLTSLKRNFGKMFTEYAQLDDLRSIINDAPKNKNWRGLKEFCTSIIRDRLLKNVTVTELEVNVRYDLTIAELKQKAGFDGYVNSDVNDTNFPEPIAPEQKRKISIVHIGIEVSTEDVEFVLNHFKLRSATTKEDLSIAIDHPDLQRKYPIAALGSVWQGRDGDRDAPYLSSSDAERGLYLYWLVYGWDDYWRFAALSK